MLDALFEKEDVTVQTIEEKIKQRRLQMLVHSCLYYEFDKPIVSDDIWQKWANELRDLQQNNPSKIMIGLYDMDFMDWDGTTGYHLPYRITWVYNKALQLIDYHKGL